MSLIVGEHPELMTVILVQGSTADLAVPSDVSLTAPTLEFAADRAATSATVTHTLALEAGEYVVHLSAAQVAALAAVNYARLKNAAGRILAAGPIQPNRGWDGRTNSGVSMARIIWGGGQGGGASTLDGLTDVDATGATTGQFLELKSGGVWGPGNAPTASWSTLSGKPAVIAAGATQAAARAAIGAGISDLALGTTSTTAKAGDWKPAAADVTDSTATGRSVLTAADGPTARAAIGAVDQAAIDTAINNLVNGAPGALDTLNELSAALGGDANFSATMAAALGNRLRVDAAQTIADGGAQARSNLGLGSAATQASTAFASAAQGVRADSADRIVGRLSGKTIVALGDSITAGTGHASYVPDLATTTGATVINGGFGGSRLALYPDAAWDAFSGHAIVAAIASGNWSLQDTHVGVSPGYAATLATLKAVNWATVDMVTFNHGTNDYSGGVTFGNSTFPATSSTFHGAMRYVIATLKTAYPHLQVAFITPGFRARFGASDPAPDTNSDVTPGGGGMLAELADVMIEIARNSHCRVLDWYRTGGVDLYNYATYLSDGLHLTPAGAAHMGAQIGRWLSVPDNPPAGPPPQKLDTAGTPMFAQVTATSKVTVGPATLSSPGTSNVNFGIMSLVGLTTGGSNCSYGASALRGVTTGTGNSGIGAQAGRSITTGNFNTALGNGAGYTDGTTATGAAVVNTTTLGKNAQASVSNVAVIGSAATLDRQTLCLGNHNALGSDVRGGFALTDASVAPTTNPTGGGILFSEGGALKWRGPSGTVTVIAPA